MKKTILILPEKQKPIYEGDLQKEHGFYSSRMIEQRRFYNDWQTHVEVLEFKNETEKKQYLQNIKNNEALQLDLKALQDNLYKTKQDLLKTKSIVENLKLYGDKYSSKVQEHSFKIINLNKSVFYLEYKVKELQQKTSLFTEIS